MLNSRFGQRSPTSSRNLPPDPVASLVYAVPADDEFLRLWKPSRKSDEARREARREHTDFFHAPGCYAETTNFKDSPEQMSEVNRKIFEVFQQTYDKGLVISQENSGQQSVTTNDYTFFRFNLTPVDSASNARAQQWLLQPLEKYKGKPMASTKVRMELQTNPKASTGNSVVFVRTHDSRVTPDMFLDSQSFAQSFRTKAVAKSLTGVLPISIVHAELLIDAAIEKKIITARMQSQQTLPNFWKLPAELRGRVYQLAADAEGSIWPVDLKTYHSQYPELMFEKLRPAFRNHHRLVHGENVIFDHGFILPKSFISLLPLVGRDPAWDPSPLQHLQDSDSSDSDHFKAFATPSLLRASKAMRVEVIKTLFMKPTFCFSQLSQLQDFMRNTLDDALSSLRKMRLSMHLHELLVLFSMARRGLTVSELELLQNVLNVIYGSTAWFVFSHIQSDPFKGTNKPFPWERLFTENDTIFVERAESMRFTHLTLDVKANLMRDTETMIGVAGWNGIPDHGTPLHHRPESQLGRLLLVKLVNLALDVWAQQNDGRPQLTIMWSDDIQDDQLEALNIMNTVYATTEVTDE